MSTKTISVSTSSYKRIRIEYVLRTAALTDLKTEDVLIDKSEINSMLSRFVLVSGGNKFRLYARPYTISSSSSIYFSYGIQVSESSGYTENITDIIVPTRIYGLYK